MKTMMESINKLFRSAKISLTLIAILGSVLVVIGLNVTSFVYELDRQQNDAQAINQFGLIRGSIQRLSKLHLLGQEETVLINQIDSIFVKIHKDYIEQKNNAKFLKETELISKMDKLENSWNMYKRFLLTDSSKTPDTQKLFYLSEECWHHADDLALTSAIVLEKKQQQFKIHFWVRVVIVISILVIVMIIIHRWVGKKLENEASHDPLTHLYNRLEFNRQIKYESDRSQRYTRVFTLILLDIDLFKNINDTYGHPVGDAVLKEFADLLEQNVRKSDMVFRTGGEEFAIILPETSLEQGKILAETLRQLIATHSFKFAETVTASFGLAQIQPSENDDQLITRTDNALYHAKNAGRNTIHASE